MKKFRKIMAVLVAAVLMVAMMVPAWADTEPETADNTIIIRVNPNKKNDGIADDGTGTHQTDTNSDAETYYAFRIFETTKKDNTAGFGDTLGTAANHTNDDIDSQYVLVTTLADEAQTFSGLKDRGFYRRSATAPYEYTKDTTISADNFDAQKGTLYVEAGTENATEGVAYFLKKTSNFLFLQGREDVKAYLNFAESADGTGYIVTWNPSKAYSEFNAKELAKVIDKYIYYVDGVYKAGAAQAGAVALSTSEVYGPISEGTPGMSVKVGYYLIKSSLGSNLILATSDIDLTDKNTFPTVDKNITASTLDTTTVFPTKTTDAQIGDTITYELTALIPDEAHKGFELHDTMYKGLSLKTDSFVVKYKVGEAEPVLLEQKEDSKDNYYVHYSDVSDDISITGTAPPYVTSATGGSSTSEPLKDDESFVVVFTKECIDKYVASRAPGAINATAQDVTFTVEYKAVLNYQARLTTDQTTKYNENKVNLVYSNYKTPDVQTKVYSHDIDLVKYYTDSSDGTTKKTLDGAKFQLYRDTEANIKYGVLQASATPLSFVKNANVYRVQDGISTTYYAGLATSDKTNVLETSDGICNIEGLDDGTYYLMETYAPNGYNKLQYMTKIIVSRDGEATKVKSNASNAAVTGTQTVGEDIFPKIDYTITGDSIVANATVDAHVYSSGGVGIENTAGHELPSTGGMGTTVLYIVGGMLVILAGAYLFFSRKRTA